MARAPQTTGPPDQGEAKQANPPAAAKPPGNALARTEGRRDVLAPLDVQATQQAMAQYQEGLTALLSDTDWQDAGRGEKFVKKSGWRKIAAWFSLDVEILSEEVTYAETDDEHARTKKGDPLRAKVIARAVAPNGRHADGDGRCSVNEDRFAQPNGRKKLDNDLPGTASTRAINRAISNLVGLGAVSGEEMGDDTTAGPPFGPALAEDRAQRVRDAIAFLADVGEGPRDDVAGKVMQKCLADGGGYFPNIVGRAFLWLASDVKALIDGEQAQTGVPAESAEQAQEAQAAEQAQAAAERDPDPPAEVVTPEADDVQHPEEGAPDGY